MKFESIRHNGISAYLIIYTAYIVKLYFRRNYNLYYITYFLWEGSHVRKVIADNNVPWILVPSIIYLILSLNHSTMLKNVSFYKKEKNILLRNAM